MGRRKKSILTSRRAILSCLLVLLTGGPDVVLCFGEDGHVALETAFPAPACAAAPREELPEGSDPAFQGVPSAGAPCCGNCLDIPLSRSELAPFPGSFWKQIPREEALPAVGSVSSAAGDAALLSRSDPAAVRLRLPLSVTRSLRTTILRI